jgi:hypothetical protein
MMVFETILGTVACEALVQLWLHAAPLQPFRELLVRMTPFLRSQDTHLLDCAYCLSAWAGILVASMYFFFPNAFLYLSTALAFHRLSNLLHLFLSYIRDKQIDIRVARR